jgi:hypothetical protein
MLKKEAKWLELKKNAPELAFSILEEFAEEFENRNVAARKVNTSAPTGTSLFGPLQGADLFGQLAKPSRHIFTGGK